MSDFTVQYLRRLRPYNLLKGGHHEDPFVREILDNSLDKETLEALDNYTRGLYDIDLHYESFYFFRRTTQQDDAFGHYIRNHPSFSAAYCQVRSDLSVLGKVTIIRPDQFDLVSWISSSAAGYGYIGPKCDNYPLARRNATRALYGFAKWRNLYRFVPDKAFARTQLSLRTHPKIRHVWGRAFHHILIEGLIGQPLLQALMLHDTPIYIGKDIHKDMPYLIIKAMANGGTCYCLDFSKFDASVCSFLVDCAWRLLYECLAINDHVDQLVFDFCFSLFTNTPLLMPDGRLYLVTSGVPSGSYFTQLIDSIVNLLCIYMFQLSSTSQVFPTKVLGDDSLFVTPLPVCEDSELSSFFAPLGLTVSEKTLVTTNYAEIVFLGHNFYGAHVTRDAFTCLSLALYTEDEVTRPQETLLRLCSLLYDSGFNSFHIFDLYKKLLHIYNIDWTLEYQRPCSSITPFLNLFMLS